MKLVSPPRHYATVEDFYAEVPDADRRLSSEWDLGVHWTEPFETGWTWPRSRLTWVEKTGELIVVRHHRFSSRDTVKVIAVIESREELERVLEGWAQRCKPEGLAWVYGRLMGFAPEGSSCR